MQETENVPLDMVELDTGETEIVPLHRVELHAGDRDCSSRYGSASCRHNISLHRASFRRANVPLHTVEVHAGEIVPLHTVELHAGGRLFLYIL